jgi:hypothetical protein
VAVTKLGKRAFAEDLRCGKAVLEDLVGIRLRGYRAPMFSLTAATPWAPAHLLEAGFAYSSSVLPAASPLHGLPGAPRGPFRWAGELLELPCPLAGWGRLSIPVLGGVYLRYLPRAVVRLAARRARHAATAWTYLHPYDFDAGAPYVRLPHAGELVSRILHHRRADTSRRVVEVLELAGAGPPLCELAQRLRDERLPVFAP